MYQKPELMVELFDVEDVITVSAGGGTTPPVEEPTLPPEAYTTPIIDL